MTKKTPKGSGCPGCTGAGAHDFSPACELEWEPPPKPAYVPPERGCMGGPLGGGWCGRPAEVVATAEDGTQWFACFTHRAGSKTVVAIEDWFKSNVDPDGPMREARLRQMLDNPPSAFAREYQGTPYRLQPEYPCQHIRWDGSPCRETATVVLRNDLSQVDRHLCEEHASPKFLRSGDHPEPRPEPPPLHITCVACPDPATGFDDLRGAFTCDRCRVMGKVKP